MAWTRDHGGAPPDLTIRTAARDATSLRAPAAQCEIIFGGDRELMDTNDPDPRAST